MKTLGLDLGTNSIGWAILESKNGKFEEPKEFNYGVHIFPEGFGEEKNSEYSLAAERTKYRSARRLKTRRRIRKYNTLKVLNKYELCPQLDVNELDEWKCSKNYPTSESFRNWLLTKDELNKNPYYFRNLVISKKLDLNDSNEAEKLGRALYHIAQRRGYKSNRLDNNQESDGKVATSISELQNKKGSQTLGQYFYSIYGNEKIRNQYTSREQDYEDEFNRICEFQELSECLKTELYDAIFYQRPLKSQKGNIANCPLEPTKKCIPLSHPLFELYRMYSFINNIIVKLPNDRSPRKLIHSEREKVVKCFLVKGDFKFEKLAKILLSSSQPTFTSFIEAKKLDKAPENLFNYTAGTSISSNKTIAQFCSIFEAENYEQLLENVKKHYQIKNNKTAEEILFEAWHFLTIAGDKKNRIDYAKKKFNLSEKKAIEFDKIRLISGHANLSQKAISMILPYLKEGLIYSHAVFMAKITEVTSNKDPLNLLKIQNDIKKEIRNYSMSKKMADLINYFIEKSKSNQPLVKEEIEKNIIQTIGIDKWEDYTDEKKNGILKDTQQKIVDQIKANHRLLKVQTLQERIFERLIDSENNFGIKESNLSKLYHPSAIEKYKPVTRHSDDKFYLESPRISSIKNPAFMRSMFRLKALINELIKTNKIDKNTYINIEMTRELNDANKRKAIQQYQRQRESENNNYKIKIEEFYQEKNITLEASDSDIEKYRLWTEQDHICPYTGNQINLTDFLSNNPNYDIEHTFPRSRGGDNSLENKTLTESRFNRENKKAKIPSELSNYQEILQKIKTYGWETKIKRLEKEIEETRIKAKVASTKDAKDLIIIRRHKLKIEKRYYQEKVFRFTALVIPSNFARNQLTNTQMLCKYSLEFLATVFDKNKISSYKFQAIKRFYDAWGIVPKTRNWHLHHCIDAFIIACISQSQYDKVSQIYKGKDTVSTNQRATLPWKNFDKFLNNDIADKVFVTHFNENDLFKQTKKAVRVRGEIKRNENDEKIYQRGQTIRGSIHKDFFYGAIKTDDKIKYVIRKPIEDMTTEKNKIIDPIVRQQILAGMNTMPDGKTIIKKARYEASSVQNPLKLKKQQHLSNKDYKQDYFVINDANYAIAIYGDITNTDNTKHITSKDVLSSFAAVKKHKKGEKLFPSHNAKGNKLRGLIKIGTKILLYKDLPNELQGLNTKQLIQRLYSVYSIEGNGCTSCRHCISNSIKRGTSQIDYEKAKETIRLSLSKILIEGKDFTIDLSGKILFKI